MITGANGFVGRVLVREFLAASHELVLVDRPGFSKGSADFPDEVNVIGADISDFDALSALEIPRVNTVIHAAGLAHQFGKVTKDDFWKINVTGTENVANLAVRLEAKHFILISSVSVYGKGDRGDSLRTETTPCRPEGHYAQSKLESEVVARKVCEENGIDLTILRLATVIGEGDAGNVSRLIRAVDRRRFYWIGKGSNRKSLLYKGDVAGACKAVLSKKERGTEIFNVSGEPATMKEIVSYIEDAIGKKTLPVALPPGLLRTVFTANSKILRLGKIRRLGETVEKWLSDETFSAESLKEAYGFEPQTGIREAIRREVEWYLANK